MILLIRSRKRPQAPGRKKRKLPMDAIVHMIMAPLYMFLAFYMQKYGVKALTEHGSVYVLKEVLFYISVVLAAFFLFGRFGQRMKSTRPPRE